MTPLDALHAAMMAAPQDEAKRRAYFARLLSEEVILAMETVGDTQGRPHLMEVDGVQIALAFDTEARLADLGGSGAYLSMRGGDLMRFLADAGLGLGVNLLGEGAAMLLPAQDVAWLADQGGEIEGDAGRLGAISAPHGASAALLGALDARLATMEGLAEAATLVGTTDLEGAPGLALVVEGAPDALRSRFAGQIAEALRVAGLEAPLDVIFAGPQDALLAVVQRHGLRFALPKPGGMERQAPGSDPDKPPRLH